MQLDTLDLLAVEMIMPFQIALLLFLIMVKVLFIVYLFTYRSFLFSDTIHLVALCRVTRPGKGVMQG